MDVVNGTRPRPGALLHRREPGQPCERVRGPLRQPDGPHDRVDAMWCWAPPDLCRLVEYESAGNMKRTWMHAAAFDWENLHGQGIREFLREATQVKNIWTPYGE